MRKMGSPRLTVSIVLICLAAGTLISAQVLLSGGNKSLSSGKIHEHGYQPRPLSFAEEPNLLSEVAQSPARQVKGQMPVSVPDDPFALTPQASAVDPKTETEASSQDANPVFVGEYDHGISPNAIDLLREFYRERNARLFELLSREFSWL